MSVQNPAQLSRRAAAKRSFGWAAVALVAAAAVAAPRPGRAAATVEELRGLTIEQLANLKVSSVFRRPLPLGRTPAAAYVITRDEIRRSGARTLPEALRLAPNLEVAQLTASAYAVSARGFNLFQLSNKLLVLVDGRSLYTPLHAGVYWDQEQVPLGDIDRIEVISGPGGTAWGANAVNGVINVITRDSRETLGGYARLDLGSVDSNGALRWGGRLGPAGAFRVYALGNDFGSTVTPTGAARGDSWRAAQTGFRADWGREADDFKLEGDAYHNTGLLEGSNSGGDLLGRWQRDLGADSRLLVRAYYDKVDREAPGVIDKLDTVDLDAHHELDWGSRQRIVWGGGYRFDRSEFRNTTIFQLVPPTENVHIANLFAEDSVSLRQGLTLTAGSKLEHSSFSGFQFLPSVRLAWQLSDRRMLWGAVSRAARTPSHLDRDIEAAGILERAGDSFGAEKLVAYELGYRAQPTGRTSYAASLYYDDYRDLRVITTSPVTGLLEFGNAQHGHVYGLETWGDYQATSRWRLSAGLDLIRKHLVLEPGATTVALFQHQGDDPDWQAFLRSYVDVGDAGELDLTLRRVASLPSPAIPGYTELDARFGWRVERRVTLSIEGRNLLDAHHPETGLPTERGEIRRSVDLSFRVHF